MDLLIKNGRIVTGNCCKEADILIKDEKIYQIGEPGSFQDAEKAGLSTLDAAGKYVIPGLVEPHMHIKAPLGGFIDILDFDTVSKCAAFGGVTTFMDFSSTLPGIPLKKAVADRKNEMKKSVQDYSLHCKVVNLAETTDIYDAMLKEAKYLKAKSSGAAEDVLKECEAEMDAAKKKVDEAVNARLQEIPNIVREGIPTFKLFLTYRKAGVMIDDVYMLKVMKAVKDAGGRCGFHAESNAIAEYNEEVFEKANRLDWADFPEYKSNLCEAEAVQHVLAFAELLNAPVYFFHLSTKESVELVRAAKERGVDVLAETCTHYLTLTKEKNKGKDGILYLMSPPLRSQEDQDALWEGLKDGTLSLVSSDNCTFTREDKEKPLNGGEPDFRKPISGVSGVEERFGLMMKAVNEGRITLQDFVRFTSENPAKIFGCYPRKGALEVGSDADLVLVDPDKTFGMDVKSLHYPESLDYAVYDGMEAKGCPETVIRRGEFLVKNGKYYGQPGTGRFLERSLKK